MEIKNKYFSLEMADTNFGPVAYAPENSPLSHELIDLLENTDELPYELTIRRVFEGKKNLVIDDNLDELELIWEDYLPNNVGIPLMSEKLYLIIKNNLTGKEGVSWLKCKVWAKNEFRYYHVIKFNKPQDVLDTVETKYVKGTDFIMTPCLSSSKAINYSVFPLPSTDNLYQLTISFFVNEKIKNEIVKENLKGILFGNVKVS